MKIPREKWKWYGHAAHFVCASRCRFHLTTVVGKTLVSTLGDLHLKDDGPMEEIGLARFFETATTKKWRPCREKGCNCGGQPVGEDWSFDEGYQTAAEAQAGHDAECVKAAQ